MAQVNINITLDSLAQAEALESALEIYVEMETERSKPESDGGGDPSWGPNDAARLKAAQQVLEDVFGHKPSLRSRESTRMPCGGSR